MGANLSQTNTNRSITKLLLKVGVSVALLAVLLSRVDVSLVAISLERYRSSTLLSALALTLLGTLISALRWWILLPEVRYSQLLRYSFIGQFYAFVLPGQIAGEAVKAWRVSRGRADGPRIAASVMIDRLVGLNGLLLVGLVGLGISEYAITSRLLLPFTALLVVLSLILMLTSVPQVATIVSQTIMLTARRLRRLDPLAKVTSSFLTAWQTYCHAPVRLAISLLLGILFQLMVIGVYYLLASDLLINVALADWMWIVSITSVAVLLPVSIAGIGLREGALISCLTYLSVDGELAIALSIGVLTMMLASALLGGLMDIRESTIDARRANESRTL